MVGVQDREECLECGYPNAFTEFQTRDGSYTMNCPRCGTHYHRDQDGETLEEHEHAYRVKWKENVAETWGGVSDLDKFLESVEEMKDDIEHVHYTYKEDGQWYLVDPLTDKEITWEEHEVAHKW